jgi:hypothetical protein
MTALSGQIARRATSHYRCGMKNPFRYFDSSPEVIRLVVMSAP